MPCHCYRYNSPKGVSGFETSNKTPVWRVLFNFSVCIAFWKVVARKIILEILSVTLTEKKK